MKNIEKTLKQIKNLIKNAPEKREVRLTFSTKKIFSGIVEIKVNGFYNEGRTLGKVGKERNRQIHITVPVFTKEYDTPEYYTNLMFN